MHARGERAGVAAARRCRRSRASCASTSLKLGFLDGVAGLRRTSRSAASTSFLKYAKLRALRAARVAPMSASTPAARCTCSSPARRLHRHARRARAARATAPRVTGVDNFDPYYDVALKEARLARLVGAAGVPLRARRSRRRRGRPRALFRDGGFTHVVHLAAQPGVRYSLVNPGAYFAQQPRRRSATCIEGCRHARRRASRLRVELVSVYGANHTLPFSEDQNVDHPVSLYAATKKANELIAHSYSHLYRLPTTGLRFFTVYGPWGRPDMAPMLFTKAILAGEPIRVFNDGKMRRDFTYVDDIVEGVVRVLDRPPGGRRGRARPTRSTTSATTRPSSSRRSSRRSSGCSAGRRSGSTRRCSRATCRRPTRRSTGSPR